MENLQGKSLRRQVSTLVKKIEAGLVPDCGSIIAEGKESRKVLKHALLRSMARTALEVEPDPRPHWRQRLAAIFSSLLVANTPVPEVPDTPEQTPVYLNAMDYTPDVTSVLIKYTKQVQSTYGARFDKAQVRGMRRFYIADNVAGRQDTFDDSTKRGRNSATKHLGALINWTVLHTQDETNDSISRLLLNSYGTAVSPFMHINQNVFGRLLQPDCELYQTVQVGNRTIPTLHPDALSIKTLNDKNDRPIRMIVPDWEFITGLEVQDGRFVSFGGLMVPVTTVNLDPGTAGCPFHDVMSYVYPEVVAEVTGWDPEQST